MNPGERFSMPLGEVMFSMRAIRRLKPDPVPDKDIRDILEAATRAPSGSNRQPWHFIVVRDPEQRRRFGDVYRKAWWAKRNDAGIFKPEDIPADDKVGQSALKLASEFGTSPVVILVCTVGETIGDMASVIPATQNLLLAARALGLGATITNLHPSTDADVKTLFGMPDGTKVIYCIPVGYPRGKFGSVTRKPLSEVVSLDRWGDPLPNA